MEWGSTVVRTDVGTRKCRCEVLEHESGELVSGTGHFVHHNTPIGRVVRKGPVEVRVSLVSVKNGVLEGDHLKSKSG